MQKTLFGAALLSVLASAAFAEQVAYMCQLKGKASGWIAPEMAIGVDGDSGRAFISDPIIMTVNEAPMLVPISENTSKKQSFNWELALTSTTGQTTKMKYRAALQFPSLRLTVYASPAGYSNRFRMQGKCAVTDQKLPDLG